jgi:hypothetical protein
MFAGCSEEEDANVAPIADAGDRQIVLPDSLVSLSGSGSDVDGQIVKYEWLFEGESTFVEVSDGDTAFRAPRSFDTDRISVLRVTDEQGAESVDTQHTVVTWLLSPNGGEQFRIGDTARISLLPTQTLVVVKLIVYRDGDYADFGIPGQNGQIWPPSNSTISFVVPDSLTDALFGRMSLVSDSCHIRVAAYNNPTTNVESAGYFSIVSQ